MTRSTVTLKTILDEHKLDGKVVRRKLREKYAKNHSKGEPWVFTAAELPKVLEVIGVKKATPKPKRTRTRKPKTTPAPADSLVSTTTPAPA